MEKYTFSFFRPTILVQRQIQRQIQVQFQSSFGSVYSGPCLEQDLTFTSTYGSVNTHNYTSQLHLTITPHNYTSQNTPHKIHLTKYTSQNTPTKYTSQITPLLGFCAGYTE